MHVRLLAERLLGEMLIAAKREGRIKPGSKNQYTKCLVDDDDQAPFTLEEVGIKSRDLSSRAQKFAALPEELFEAKLPPFSPRKL